VKTGVQKLCNQLKKLDSGLSALSSRPKGFRRNDKKWFFSTFYEFIKKISKEFLAALLRGHITKHKILTIGEMKWSRRDTSELCSGESSFSTWSHPPYLLTQL